MATSSTTTKKSSVRMATASATRTSQAAAANTARYSSTMMATRSTKMRHYQRQHQQKLRKTVVEAQQENLPVVAPSKTLLEWFKKSPSDRKATKPAKVSLPQLFRFSTTAERWWMAGGLFLAFLSGFGLPVWLALLARSLDKFNNLAQLINAIGGEGLQNALQQELTNLVVAFVYVGVLVLVTGSAYVSIWTYTGEKQALRIQEMFVASALQQDAAWFDEHDREQLPTQIATSMVHLQAALGRTMAGTFANFITACGCLAVALVLNTPLALVMLCVVPIVFLCVSVLSCFIRKESAIAAKAFDQAGAVATEVISGIKTVAALCAQRWALDKYEEKVRESQKHAIRSGFLQSGVAGITGFLFYCTYTVAFIIGTEQVKSGAAMTTIIQCFFDNDPNCRVTGASVMCCIYGVILCATFFGLMAPGIQAILLGRQAAVEIYSTIRRVPEIDAASKAGRQLENVQGALEFQNVLFAYPSRPQNIIFRNFSLKIEAGQSVALCGPSGSGKSTIARLLLRFYNPTAGSVLVDGGVPITDLNVAWWRQQIGYVAQEPNIFPGTLRFNIAVGKPGGAATDEEVEAAARAACAHEFITDLPEGYDTFYSGTSIQLSGGQMQRIAIARAIIRNPAVLLLDEATSALDSNSEGQVQRALANVRKVKQMTTVTVAHRLSTIISSDQIAVIADGTIAELGTHRSLFAQNGIYTTLCQSQGITADSEGAEARATDDNKKNGAAAAVTTKAGSDEYSVEVRVGSSVNKGDIEEGVLAELDEDKMLEEEEEEELQEEELASVSRLLETNRQEWYYIASGLVGAAIVGSLSPIEAVFTAEIVANYYDQEPENMAQANLRWSCYFLILAGGAVLGNLLVGSGLSVSGFRLARRMRVMAFDSIVRRNMGFFDVPEHSVGELTTRLAADAELVANITGYQLGYLVRMCASLATGLIIALVFSWQVGLTACACVPFILGASIVQAKCLSKRYVDESDGLSPATILEQGLRQISAVQAYDLQKEVGDDYTKALEPEMKSKVKQGVIAGCCYGFTQFSIFVSFAIFFYVGSLLLVRGKLDFRQFFTSILSVMFGAVGMAQVSADLGSRQDGQAAAARIFTIVDMPFDGSDPFSDKGEKPSSFDGTVSFESCQFYYPTRPNNPIYYGEGVNLSIAAKESVAFVGNSGCGKSTAQQLVLRFYDATGGTVRVDGYNVEDLNITWLRGQIGYVGQQPVLFSGTIRDNILLGKPDATEDEIIAAGKAANAHDFVMNLAGGYDTDIGTAGSLLSGGQKQRIAIARAIVKKPKILVLDEATSALDNESERVVQAALNKMQKTEPRTSLVVAHRLMTVKDCDRIAVLGEGRVKELGPHDSLLQEKDGLYRELWMKQGAGEESKKNQ